MPISSNSSYLSTMTEFSAHWAQCNTALSPATLVLQLPDNTTMTRAQFISLRDTVQARQYSVQDRLVDEQIARGALRLQKGLLLGRLNQFIGKLEAYFRNTAFYEARPYAPGLRDGQRLFTKPLVDAMKLWTKINAGTPPPGLALPLVLAGGTGQGDFASEISALQFDYAAVDETGQNTTLARSERNKAQATAYAAMKAYRETVPPQLAQHPELIVTLPRLTPLPGHTPKAVNASGIFLAPDQSRVVFSASDEPTLLRYELRGTVGDRWDEDDAVFIASLGPDAPREFVTDFGLGQPGAEVSLKVFVVLTTGNEAGSAAMQIERPLSQVA